MNTPKYPYCKQALNSQEKIPWNCKWIPLTSNSKPSVLTALLTFLQNHAKITDSKKMLSAKEIPHSFLGFYSSEG
jgi:hypothetical protein